jgi:hypothetical protein
MTAKKATKAAAQPAEEKDSKPQQVETPPDSPPADVPLERNPTHEVDEDPEQHLGDEITDPWLDPEQSDWVSGPNEVADETDEEESN